MPTQVFPGSFNSLTEIAALIQQASKEAGLDECATYKIETSVDEACSNIIEHAYAGSTDGTIEITYTINSDRLTIVLKDHGQPFNPKSIPSPDTKAPIEDRKAHGMGLYMMRKWMDEITFEFRDGTNILTMVKFLG
jgi:serine/threonine-protein kinase RsbW